MTTTSRARVGVYLSPRDSLAGATGLVRRAEDLGYDSVWVTHGAGRDAFLVLAAYASRTARIGLGTGVVAVALPEEMPVAETIELAGALRRDMGLALELTVMNAMLPERFSGADTEAIDRVDGAHGAPVVAAALRAALSEHRRARAHRGQLRRLRSGLDGEVVTLPYLFQPDLGLDEWKRLSADLERRL